MTSEVTRDITERRLNPAYLLISFGRSLISLLPVIAVGIWKAPGWSIGVLAGLLALRAIAEWWTRRYSVVDGSLRVRSGLFNKTQDTIAVNRITALDAERSVVQRVLRVWGLRIQTPGNDHRAALHLHTLSPLALEELRAALHQPTPAVRTDHPDPGEADGTQSDRPAKPTTLAVLDTRTLLLAALTGTSIPLMFAGAAAAFGRIRDVLPERVLHRLSGEVFGGGRTTVLILLAAVIAAVVAGIVLTSLRLANFTLVRDGDRLRISRGLLAQRSGTIPVDRVQAVRVVQGWWRRRLGYCALEVEVAGLSTSNDAERMLFPLVRLVDAADLVGKALPELRWHPSPLRAQFRPAPDDISEALPPADRASRRPLLVALPGWGAYLAIAPIPLALLVGSAQAKAAAWTIDVDTVTFRWHRILASHTVRSAVGRPGSTDGPRLTRHSNAGPVCPARVCCCRPSGRRDCVTCGRKTPRCCSMRSVAGLVPSTRRRRPEPSSPPRTVNSDGRQQPTLTPPPPLGGFVAPPPCGRRAGCRRRHRDCVWQLLDHHAALHGAAEPDSGRSHPRPAAAARPQNHPGIDARAPGSSRGALSVLGASSSRGRTALPIRRVELRGGRRCHAQSATAAVAPQGGARQR